MFSHEVRDVIEELMKTLLKKPQIKQLCDLPNQPLQDWMNNTNGVSQNVTLF